MELREEVGSLRVEGVYRKSCEDVSTTSPAITKNSSMFLNYEDGVNNSHNSALRQKEVIENIGAEKANGTGSVNR